MARIIKAIQLINPNADCSVEDDNIDKIRWYDGNPKNITKSQIKSKLPEVDSQIIIEEKREQRRNAYPSIGDQLDMLWHSIDQNPKLKSEYFDFYETLKAVKVKYPKNG